jgi:hypothetical protein
VSIKHAHAPIWLCMCYLCRHLMLPCLSF